MTEHKTSFGLIILENVCFKFLGNLEENSVHAKKYRVILNCASDMH